MKIKKLSILLALLLFVATLSVMGCKNSSQDPEAFAVSIYKVEKEQDDDGNVSITNYALWKSYNVTPTQAIDLPDYNPEKADKDSKMSYKNNYSTGRDDVSGEVNGKILNCKNKIQFIPYAASIIYVRERQKKTINFFYEGKNIAESLSATQIEKFNKIFKDTYSESFSATDLADFLKTLFRGSFVEYWERISVQLYTKDNGENPFGNLTCVRYDESYYGYSNDYFSGSFTLIKNTDVYVKIETIETQSQEGSRVSVIEEERREREKGYNSQYELL